jgi:hypothetical protein
MLALNASEAYFHQSCGSRFFSHAEIDLFHLGQNVAMSIVQGGNGLPFLSEAVFFYFVTSRFDCTRSCIDISETTGEHIT